MSQIETDVDRTVDDVTARVFSVSILISAVRCLLTYVLFPWVLPAAGEAGGVGPGLGLVVGLVAIFFNLASIRRFWRSRHRWRWAITAINGGVIVLVTILVFNDLSDLLA